MTFDINKFASGGGQSSRGTTQQEFLYLSKTDTLATIKAAGYFNNAVSKISVDDIIFARGSDGAVIIAVSVVPTVGDVEVIESYGGSGDATLPIDLTTDVTGILPPANGGDTLPIDLATDVTGILPPANGGNTLPIDLATDVTGVLLPINGGDTLPIKLATTDTSGILPLAKGGAGGIGAGSIPFGKSGVFSEQPTQLFWDDNNFFLGIGTNPNAALHVVSGGIIAGASPTGGDKGVGTVNAEVGSFVNGVQGAYKTGRTISISGSFLTSDCILGVDDTSALRTVEISTAVINQGSPTNFREIIIKDESGGAGTNNISITTEGAQSIDGVPDIPIAVNWGVLKLYSNGSNLFTL